MSINLFRPGTVVNLYLSANTTLDAGDLLLGTRTVASLAPGASASSTTQVLVRICVAAGDWFIIAVADVDGAVAESSETNNTLSKGIKVKR